MMRTPLLTGLVLTLSVSVAQAQPPTEQERKQLLTHLERTQAAFAESIQNLSEAQWTFRAGADRWTIAEVAEHIAISETTIREMVTGQVLKSPAVPRNPNPIPDEKLLAMLLDRTSKFQAPEMLKPTNRWSTREALTEDFHTARAKTMEYVKTTADDLHGHAAPHPALKMLDAYQWLLLLSGHTARHTAQIVEVKTAAGFPR